MINYKLNYNLLQYRNKEDKKNWKKKQRSKGREVKKEMTAKLTP